MTQSARVSIRTLLGLLLLLVAGPALAQPPQKVTPDGGRATAVHRIPLYHAEGEKIGLDDDPLLPFSTRHTCGQCHDYETIARGHHFNAGDPRIRVSEGEDPGEPWVLFDRTTGTQLPLSYRHDGFWTPDDVGLTPWNFIRAFGAFFPGGFKGEPEKPAAEEGARWFATGKLEINCLLCHNASRAQNGSEWAKQISKQNFLWAAAAASDLAVVEGSVARVPDSFDPFMETNAETRGPKVFYDRSRFNARGEVFFDIVRRPDSSRCYFCHTTRHLGPGVERRWNTDRDVHLVRGMQCTDCHRNGLDHDIVRGHEYEDLFGHRHVPRNLTCRGCHLGVEGLPGGPLAAPGGRLAAPVPEHRGLPPIHFKRLSCTACHSGPRPGAEALRAQSSASHRIGVHGGYRGEDSPPFVLSPVLARRDGPKIAPYKAIWPAFWGVRIKGEFLKPLSHFRVREIAGKILEPAPEPDPSAKPGAAPDTKPAPAKSNLTRDRVRAVLARLVAARLGGAPFYVSGGRLYELDDAGALTKVAHWAAKPLMWPLGHDVRPASQALGSGGCTDCHAEDAPFHFGLVTALAPAELDPPLTFEMHEFQELDVAAVRTLTEAFKGRAWFKTIGFIASAVIALVLTVLLFHATGHWLRRPATVTRTRSRLVGLAVLAASVLVLAVTGLGTWLYPDTVFMCFQDPRWWGEPISRLTGTWLILHCAAGLILVVGLACRAVTWTTRSESAANRGWLWVTLGLGLAAAVTALGGMTELLGSSEIADWLEIHRWTALLATGAILVYVFRAVRHLRRARREQLKDGEAR